MTGSTDATASATEREEQPDKAENDGNTQSGAAAADASESADPDGLEARDEAAEVASEPVESVVARNQFRQNTIIVKGDFIGSVDGEQHPAIPITDISAAAGSLSEEFVESPSFSAAVQAIKKSRLALLAGGGCGNRVTAAVALHRTDHEPIVELPGALAARDLIEAVKQVCKKESAGVLVDSVDAETLMALTGFHLRHLHSMLPPHSAVVITTRAQPHTVGDHELPTIDGVPPDQKAMVQVLAQREGLEKEGRALCLEAIGLLTPPIAPASIARLVALAPTAQSAEQLVGSVDGRSPLLDEWLGERPEAASLAALAAAACLDGLPSADFDQAAWYLTTLLEGELEPPSEPPRFGVREAHWPAGVARFRRRQVPTHFGWQETEVVELCAPHSHDGVVTYLWSHLGGEFRRPFIRWMLELPTSSNNRLALAAARTVGVLFAHDPVTVEREILRPWALSGDKDLRSAAGFALGIPVIIGADPVSPRHLVEQWLQSSNEALRAAALAAYGGPLGIWDPSAAAASRLWEAGSDAPELRPLADASLAALFVGGPTAGRARATTVAVLRAVASKAETRRAYAILPLALRALTGHGSKSRESLEALLGESESETFAGIAALLARSIDSVDGRDSARQAIRNVLGATAAGRISQGATERLIREMKAAAAERGRLPELGSQVKQLLKAEERDGGRLQDVARSLHETFYESSQGG